MPTVVCKTMMHTVPHCGWSNVLLLP